MWDETKRQRFSLLRTQAKRGTLTAAEQRELDELYRDLEAREAASLQPAMAHKQEETAKLRALNEALRDVIRRKEEHPGTHASHAIPVAR